MSSSSAPWMARISSVSGTASSSTSMGTRSIVACTSAWNLSARVDTAKRFRAQSGKDAAAARFGRADAVPRPQVDLGQVEGAQRLFQLAKAARQILGLFGERLDKAGARHLAVLSQDKHFRRVLGDPERRKEKGGKDGGKDGTRETGGVRAAWANGVRASVRRFTVQRGRR